MMAVLAVTDDDGRVGHVDNDGRIGRFARTQDWRLPAETMAFAVIDDDGGVRRFARTQDNNLRVGNVDDDGRICRFARTQDWRSPAFGRRRWPCYFRLPALQPGRFSYIWRHLRNCTV